MARFGSDSPMNHLREDQERCNDASKNDSPQSNASRSTAETSGEAPPRQRSSGSFMMTPRSSVDCGATFDGYWSSPTSQASPASPQSWSWKGASKATAVVAGRAKVASRPASQSRTGEGRRSSSRPAARSGADELVEEAKRVAADFNRGRRSLPRTESEKMLKLSGRLDRLTGLAREAARERSLTPTPVTASTPCSATPRSPRSPRPVTPLKAVSPQAFASRAAGTASTSSLSPFPATKFGTASRSPSKPWLSRFESSPAVGAYSPRECWSPVCEGKTAPGVAVFGTSPRGPVKPWQASQEKSPGVDHYSPRTSWSPVSQGKPAPGVSAFGTASKSPRKSRFGEHPGVGMYSPRIQV
eukprot:TRINITY_DN111369_c0_g1_i1.p1 TRINITY_DN111369_c0_g1~~TRINITY_DN111369_c0_g1_i1.p1  ORF type:complete len:357 (-),score=39.40 TRINITY_DN111369_c0_g1_i1:10-1080(-)